MNIRLPRIGLAVHYSFVLTFTPSPGHGCRRVWKANLTQQWIHLFMENLMMQVAFQ